MRKNFWRCLAAAIVAYGTGCWSAEAKLFDVTEFYLDNGMQVIVIPNSKAPIVKQMVWYKAGSVDEPLGKGGLAHLLEHLMFRGTEKVPGSEFNDIVTNNGGVMNAFTSQDFTTYHEFVDVSRLELVMFLEADRMKNLNITPEAFEKERDIVYQERKQVVENNPTAYFGEAMRRTLWQEHPYSRPVTGMPDEILNLKLEDAVDFYQDYYAPNNAVLVLSGDITPVQAETLAKKYFGDLEADQSESKPRTDWPKLDKTSSTKLEMKLPQVNVKRFVKSFIVAPYAEDKEQAFAMMVLSAYLGEGETSKLYRKLVEDDEIALSVSTAYDFSGRSYGTFVLEVMPKEGVSNAELEEAINEAVKEALDDLDLRELQKIKRKMLAGLQYLKDNPSDAANIVGALAASGLSVEEIVNYDKSVEAVSLRDIKQAAQVLLASINVQGILSPMKEGR